MLLTSLYVQKLQFISHKLCPSPSPHGQLCELVFFSHTKALIFLRRHTRLFVEPAIWALLFVSIMTTVLVQSLIKMHMILVFHNKFRMIVPISWIKKHFHQISKAVVLQRFFKISVLKNFAIFTRKHLCWSYFLRKLQASYKLQPFQHAFIAWSAEK